MKLSVIHLEKDEHFDLSRNTESPITNHTPYANESFSASNESFHTISSSSSNNNQTGIQREQDEDVDLSRNTESPIANHIPYANESFSENDQKKAMWVKCISCCGSFLMGTSYAIQGMSVGKWTGSIASATPFLLTSGIINAKLMYSKVSEILDQIKKVEGKNFLLMISIVGFVLVAAGTYLIGAPATMVVDAATQVGAQLMGIPTGVAEIMGKIGLFAEGSLLTLTLMDMVNFLLVLGKSYYHQNPDVLKKESKAFIEKEKKQYAYLNLYELKSLEDRCQQASCYQEWKDIYLQVIYRQIMSPQFIIAACSAYELSQLNVLDMKQANLELWSGYAVVLNNPVARYVISFLPSYILFVPIIMQSVSDLYTSLRKIFSNDFFNRTNDDEKNSRTLEMIKMIVQQALNILGLGPTAGGCIQGSTDVGQTVKTLIAVDLVNTSSAYAIANGIVSKSIQIIERIKCGNSASWDLLSPPNANIVERNFFSSPNSDCIQMDGEEDTRYQARSHSII